MQEDLGSGASIMIALVSIEYLLDLFGTNRWVFALLLILAFIWLLWQLHEPVAVIFRGLRTAVSRLRKRPFSYEYMAESITIVGGRGTSADDPLIVSGTKYLDASILSELAYIRHMYPRYRVDTYAIALHPSAADPYETHVIYGMETQVYIGDIPPYSHRFDLYRLVRGNGRRTRLVCFDASKNFNGVIKDKGLHHYVARLSDAAQDPETNRAVIRHLTCVYTLLKKTALARIIHEGAEKT